ncbi:MAG: hypothetical protein ACK53L_12715, partial [Pirellulaceae bacterium]
MKDFDIVVFGATSFVGRILCRYLLDTYGADGSRTAAGGAGQALRWAIAARSGTRLEELKRELGSEAAGLPILVADAADESALRALVGRSRVIVSTVGP